jgi:ParB family transcriptional regulator, chromosome partitioning protein
VALAIMRQSATHRLARRKAIYESMHPETKLGANQHEGRVRQNGEPTTERFTKDTADKTGMSERTVKRAAPTVGK